MSKDKLDNDKIAKDLGADEHYPVDNGVPLYFQYVKESEEGTLRLFFKEFSTLFDSIDDPSFGGYLHAKSILRKAKKLPLSEETLNSIKRGLADSAAGRVTSLKGY